MDFWLNKNVEDIEKRATAAYLGLAIGDALGATLEFMTPAEIKAKHGVLKNIVGGGWLRLKAGQVTDDTTMALALGNSIIDQQAIDANDIAKAFSNWMASKPVDIGNTVRRGILHFRRTNKPVSPWSEHDAGNGAVMRCLPSILGTLGLSNEIVSHAVLTQAHTTHHNEVSDAAQLCIAQSIEFLFLGADKAAILVGPIAELIQKYPDFRFRDRRRENPTGYVVDTMQAVFQAFIDTDSFENCLIDAVNRGGDSDTVGAIAGMLAGSYYGINAIPKRWLKALDGDIKAQCEQQAIDLVRFAHDQYETSQRAYGSGVN